MLRKVHYLFIGLVNMLVLLVGDPDKCQVSIRRFTANDFLSGQSINTVVNNFNFEVDPVMDKDLSAVFCKLISVLSGRLFMTSSRIWASFQSPDRCKMPEQEYRECKIASPSAPPDINSFLISVFFKGVIIQEN